MEFKVRNTGYQPTFELLATVVQKKLCLTAVFWKTALYIKIGRKNA